MHALHRAQAYMRLARVEGKAMEVLELQAVQKLLREHDGEQVLISLESLQPHGLSSAHKSIG